MVIQSNKPARLKWMDSLKLLTIFFVCWGHTIIFYGIDKDYAYEIQPTLFIYSFHMPLFMTISGYFSAGLAEGRYNFKKKFIQLILPTITLGTLCLIVGIDTLNFWYLKSLFACYVICALLFRWLNWGRLIPLVIISGFVLFPLVNLIPFIGSYKIDFMLPFFLLGMAIKRNNILNTLTLVISLLGFLICLVFWRVDDIWYAHMSKWIDYKELIIHKNIVFNMSSFGHYVFRFITGALGSLAFISVFKVIDKIEVFCKLFGIVGKYGEKTLDIYLIQSFIIEVNPLKLSFPLDSVYMYSFVYSLIYTIIAVFACILISCVLERSKYISLFVFGRT